MSVINQMLNDLHQREQQTQQVSGEITASSVIAAKASSNRRNLVLAVLLTLSVCGIAFFLWQLSNENQVLKQTLASQVLAGEAANKTVITESAADKALVAEQPGTEPVIKEVVAVDKPSSDKSLAKVEKAAEEEPLAVKTPQTGEQVSKKSKLLEKPLRLSLSNSLEQTIAKSSEQPAEKAPVTTKDEPRLAISRKQLSADEMVEQKWQQAEQAINSKQLAVAEELLEDILLLQPEHAQGRKQLAALWFGRQAYQAAINVLAQGISLTPDNHEFRLMQAKIYLSQGLKEKAYQVLQVLAGSDNHDYLGALANAAQQTGRYQQASELYQQLTQAQPGLSRWWLGLGVAHDSNSRFELAITAYRYALETGNLSMSSSQFARQRLQQLGG
ncbi:tetratricopeptide repeat protein [Thalassomonas viridans]|uniref:Tetratricopeptide repeat protein n=1 Tax=Thalassomonas viridans TaxID=137584 RepID=A0AAF0C8L6_9GAMM|nr:tetratricopeptide repeat protein [Thalassomonas viridans]WDE04501.1 tetratricopeptide repeat protein [Thalassomonas viridans]